jgi:hypothetical protein
MTKGIVRAVNAARKWVDKEISDSASVGGMYARGMAAEGYAGGYRDALDDVMLALNGVKPSRRGYWRDWR